MSKPTVDFGRSARARLLAVANRRGVQLEYVLLRYAFERFLYRLGESAHANRFISEKREWVFHLRMLRAAPFAVVAEVLTC